MCGMKILRWIKVKTIVVRQVSQSVIVRRKTPFPFTASQLKIPHQGDYLLRHLIRQDMSELYFVEETRPFICWDRKTYHSFEDQLRAMYKSKTLYVGNLSFFTTELQIENVFNSVGPVKRVIMGLNNITKTPCGFCFVEYYTHENAAAALKYISGTVCDGKIIRCDLDSGFKQGRQYGRGSSGGQARDDRRQSYEDEQERDKIRQPHHKKSTGKRDRRSNINDKSNDDRKRDAEVPLQWLAGALPSPRAPIQGLSILPITTQSPVPQQAIVIDINDEIEDGGGKRRRM